ncbi:hypothetical protein [Pleurocapsa sp. FMAR1]|uniref:hypothetical protein n=1 Tax=Pleurocapsa sp. FMAR1 TaxID=3040204 RepID=UPI0029C82085|nr:hypothetical protein [Pleurocapsa sp. FMAR1]
MTIDHNAPSSKFQVPTLKEQEKKAAFRKWQAVFYTLRQKKAEDAALQGQMAEGNLFGRGLYLYQTLFVVNDEACILTEEGGSSCFSFCHLPSAFCLQGRSPGQKKAEELKLFDAQHQVYAARMNERQVELPELPTAKPVYEEEEVEVDF